MMLSRLIKRSHLWSRSLTHSSTLLNEKFLSPDEYINKKHTEDVKEEIYRDNLLGEEFKYDPKFISENKADPSLKRPIPINVELLKYKPLKLAKTHGHEAARVNFRGYDVEDVTRAAEFACRAAFYIGIPTSLVIPKKTEKRLYTVIKSPFAQAKSKENFMRTTFHKQLNAYDATPEVVDLWLSFVNKHAIEGVQYLATITTRESLDFSRQLDDMSSNEIKLSESYQGTDDPITAKVEELLKSDTFKKYLDAKD